MDIQTFKAKGLAQLSYLVSSGSKAFIIDPQLDCEQYIEAALKANVAITCIFETHRNEDFISGAAALAKYYDIPVYHGQHSDGTIEYASYVADGDSFDIGDLHVKVIETPGHTKDSICISVADTAISKEEIALFTGDTLFVNDVGRTDFYPDEKEKMASILFESLQKLTKLPDSTVIYPAHGAGSVCGGGMADREFSTLGYERRHNPKFSLDSRDTFIKQKLSETHYYAPYFKKMERLNMEGKFSCIHRYGVPLLVDVDIGELSSKVKSGETQIVDVRAKDVFCRNHISGSLFFGEGLISAYAGWFLTDEVPIVLVASSAQDARQNALQLNRMGYDNIAGYISAIPVKTGDQSEDWGLNSFTCIHATEVQERLSSSPTNWHLLDVRKQDERESGAIKGSEHLYLGYLSNAFSDNNQNAIDANDHYTVYCGSGVRATTAASFLAKHNVKHVDIMEGSMKAWQKLN